MLKRSNARWCISLAVLGWLLLSLKICWPREVIGRWGLVIGMLFLVASFIIKFTLLKCTHCGVGGLIPQWSKNDTYHCIKCGTLVHWE